MSNNRQSAGIGFTGALFLVFLVLRLTDNIDWAWYWVASPLWMPLAIALGVVLLCIPLGAAWDTYAVWHNKRTRAARAAELEKRRGVRS